MRSCWQLDSYDFSFVQEASAIGLGRLAHWIWKAGRKGKAKQQPHLSDARLT